MADTAVVEERSSQSLTLPAWGVVPVTVQLLLLVSASFVLPVAAHLAGLPVRSLLPMHWPILLIGLIYGWRSGLAAGLLAPILSFAVSGMPLPHILPSMTVELAAYGLVAGVMRQAFGLNLFLSVGIALVTGRIVFLLVVFSTGAVSQGFSEYLAAAMAPGLYAALGQFILLPLIAMAAVGKRGAEESA
ncbi:MAG TPA: ECF transporter S component [Pyrinomonadaceae bacterium]|nr:ECF transporter S component [Pyrinomonadaceae bacterium]HMP65031.1 ECF transporter S component [Pyrinomonadaceae bacterium]